MSACLYTRIPVERRIQTMQGCRSSSMEISIYKKQKKFSEKQKDFRDGLSYSTPQKSEETRGNAITQPQSHPIKKMQNLGTSLNRDLVCCSKWRRQNFTDQQLAKTATLASLQTNGLKGATMMKVMSFCALVSSIIALVRKLCQSRVLYEKEERR